MGALEGKEVLIVGATGFVGSHLTKRLVKENAKVNIISRSSDLNGHSFLKDFSGTEKVCKCDLSNFESLKNCIERINPEKIYHLGAFVNLERTFKVADICVQTNIQGTVNLLHALESVDYTSFINVGTTEVHGLNSAPFKEEQKIDPVSPYAASKASSEFFCNFAYRIYNSAVVLLRISTVYGPGQSQKRLIPHVIECCYRNMDVKLTKGDQTRDFTYVDDIVDGIVRASIEEKAVGEVINLGGHKEYSIAEVATRIIDLMDSDVAPIFGALPVRGFEHKRWYCDITKAKKILNWEPKIELEQGLNETIDWYVNKFQSGGL